MNLLEWLGVIFSVLFVLLGWEILRDLNRKTCPWCKTRHSEWKGDTVHVTTTEFDTF